LNEELLQLMAGEITLSKNPGGSMKKWREIFGISQTELAEYLKVSPSTISDYEGGRRASPGIQVVKRLCETLLAIDEKHGSNICKQLEKKFSPKEEPFGVHEFSVGVKGDEFLKKIEGIVVANPSKVRDTNLYGYTLIDSLKAILEVPIHEYLKMYGKTPERALIFQGVENGRSPMIAVRIGRFSTDMKPAMVVLHGIDEVDPIAIKIAEVEKIPLLTTKKPITELEAALKEL
jgi:putative transcriptional regulator